MLRDNPESSYLALKKNITNALLPSDLNIEESVKIQIEQLQETLKNKEKKESRLKEVFSGKIQEFRHHIFYLLGILEFLT